MGRNQFKHRAELQIDCPKCGAKEGAKCFTPAGSFLVFCKERKRIAPMKVPYHMKANPQRDAFTRLNNL